MQCEICGKETASSKRIELDGSILLACSQCAGFGKEKPLAYAAEPQRETWIPKKINRPAFEQQEFDLGLEIVADYGRAVRKARESKGLTVKELAAKVFEKESLLHRIENESIKPSNSLIAKLEKQLGIGLKKKTN